jgi:inorganic pyrophosphatase
MRTVPFPVIYRTLLTTRRPVYVVMEHRKNKFINNYGELPQFINRADGDPWDVIVPGYPMLEYDKPYKFKKLMGVYALPNGNHKLIVDVFTDHERDINKVHRHVKKFQKKYEEHTKLKGSILYF